MKKFDRKMTLKEFAIAVARLLSEKNIDVVLAGGAVVSIYSDGKYVSKDADFLSVTDHQAIKNAMLDAGFKNLGKDFTATTWTLRSSFRVHSWSSAMSQ